MNPDQPNSEIRTCLAEFSEASIPPPVLSVEREVSYLRGYIASTLRGRRLELGLSQQEVAERAGVSQSVVSDVEREKGLALETTTRIARALQLKLAIRLDRPAAG